MASFRHSVSLPRAPEEVFPWLLEPDKVPRWTSRLEGYEQTGDGPIGRGSRIRQVLTVKGQRLDVELEVTAYDPPRSAESRFSLQGVDVVTSYTLAVAGSGTELTQTLGGRATSFTARMLLPVVQPHLERKLIEDLERLRELLSG
ncbi:MAG: SRPBCC family protein [Solirubrobacteraceae bacterium]